MTPPFVPKLESKIDCRYFDEFDAEMTDTEIMSYETRNQWRGFTFKSNAALRRLTMGTWGRGLKLNFESY